MATPCGYTSRPFYTWGVFDAGQAIEYDLKISGNGIYIFVIEGELETDGQVVNERDAFGAVAFNTLPISTRTPSKILIIEVPMQFNDSYGN